MFFNKLGDASVIVASKKYIVQGNIFFVIYDKVIYVHNESKLKENGESTLVRHLLVSISTNDNNYVTHRTQNRNEGIAYFLYHLSSRFRASIDRKSTRLNSSHVKI